jgi:hypothetical protein
MVKVGADLELEGGDALLVYSKETRRKIGKGKFKGVFLAKVQHTKKGNFYNGIFVTHLVLIHADNSEHAYSIDRFKFKLKEKVNWGS